MSLKIQGMRNIKIICSLLVNDLYQNFDYLDFGISTENNGLLLNEGLLMQKELSFFSDMFPSIPTTNFETRFPNVFNFL